MRKLTPLLLALFTLPALAQPAPEKEQPRTITTTGEAVVYVMPDEVTITFGIEAFDGSIDKARASVEQSAARLVKAIKDLKIEDKHIATDVMTVDVRYRSSSPLLVEGYVCRRTYSVCLKDVKKFETFIDTILKNGANQLQGFEFRSSEFRKHRDAARRMAVKAAKEKAADLAKELECGVGKPRTITEGFSIGYGWGGANRYGNEFNNAQVQVQAPAGGDAAADQSMPLGQIGIRAGVSVVFDLTTNP